MRPIEILLLFANLLRFLVLVVPHLRAVRWTGHIVIITLFIAIVQELTEGPRWQMAPAYTLTGIFLFAWLLQNFAQVGGSVKKLLANRTVKGLAIILCVIGMGLSAILPIILPVFHFPRPGGPYDISTVTYHWTDTSRREIFSSDKNMRRELMVQVWYPARKDSSSSHALYLPDADIVTAALTRLHNFPDFSLQYLKYVTTNASESIPIADDQPHYPVLIVLEGLTGYRQMNTFQVEELVSRGYMVVGIDQPGAAATVVFPDGHQIALTPELFTQVKPLVDQSLSPAEKAPQLNGQIFKNGILPYFAQDVSFTLDQLASLNTKDPKGILTGKLDLEHTGVFGMSLGGMIGAQACLKDPRIKVCLLIDVAMTADVVQQGLRQPAMWITRPADTMRLERQKAGGWAEKDILQTQATMREVYTHLPGAGYFVQIPGAFHIDFTDLASISPLFPLIGFSGPVGVQRTHEVVNAYSVAFFDKHLKGEPEGLLNGSTKFYPEVIFEKHLA